MKWERIREGTYRGIGRRTYIVERPDVWSAMPGNRLWRLSFGRNIERTLVDGRGHRRFLRNTKKAAQRLADNLDAHVLNKHEYERRSGSRENPSNVIWLLIGGGAVAAGAAIYFMSRSKTAAAAVASTSAAPAMTAASTSTPAAASSAPVPVGRTPATTLTTGQVYTFYGAVPGGVSDATTLATALAAGGWTGVSVPYFNGQGALPPGIPSTGFVAVGTWNGPNGLVAQPGYTCVAGNCVLTTYVS
jgi:hypothetical protein